MAAPRTRGDGPLSPKHNTALATRYDKLARHYQALVTIASYSSGFPDIADTTQGCAGFRPALSHRAPSGLRGPRGHIATAGTRAVDEPPPHLLGHGDWTGPVSATLIDVGRPAGPGRGPRNRRIP